MRSMVPKQLLPSLHTSSFLAWQTLPLSNTTNGNGADSEERLAEGFVAQSKLVSLAAEAVVRRALREQVSLILEGVHIHAPLVDVVPKDSDAIVVPVMLAVLRKGSPAEAAPGPWKTGGGPARRALFGILRRNLGAAVLPPRRSGSP